MHVNLGMQVHWSGPPPLALVKDFGRLPPEILHDLDQALR
jgi:hypothetical protein